MALTEVSIALWFIYFGFTVLLGIVMVRKALNQDYTRIKREYFLGIAIFAFVHLVARIFYYYFDFIFIGDERFWTWGAIIAFIGLAFLLYAIERNIFTKSKFIFTILAIIAVILLLIVPTNIGTVLQNIFLPILGPTVPLLYFYIAYKSTSEVRINSLLNGFGVFVFLAGQVAHSKFFYEIGPEWQPIYFIVSPILLLIGSIMFFYGLVRPQ